MNLTRPRSGAAARRGCRLLAVSLWVVALLVAGAPGRAGAEAPDAVGWWFKPKQGPASSLIVTKPPVVPEGGLYVANDPSGAAAVSAVRVPMAADPVTATLTLVVASGSVAPAAVVKACPTTSAWEPVENGAWDERPTCVEDGLSISGVLADDGSTVSWSLPPTFAADVAGATLDILLVPAGSEPFSMAFEPPGDEAFSAGPPPSSFEPAPATEPGGSPGFEPGTAFVPQPSPSFTAPPATAFTPPGSPEVGTPAASDDASVASGPVAEAALPASPRLPEVEDSPATRIVAVALLGAIGAGLWLLSQRPQRVPRLLGALGGGATAPRPAPAVVSVGRARGVGRFARPRAAPPTRL